MTTATVGNYQRKQSKVNHKFNDEDQLFLVRKAKEGDINARNALVTSFIPAIYYVVKKYDLVRKAHLNGISIEDIYSEGVILLCRLTETFKEERHVKFRTYALRCLSLWLPDRIYRLKNDIPHYLKSRVKKAKELEFRLKESGLRITPEDIKRFFSQRYLYEAFLRNESDHNTRDEDITSQLESIANSNNDEGFDLDRIFFPQLLENSLDEIPKRERLIIKYRFGLYGSKIRTLKELGDKIGISNERVRQLQKKALGSLNRIIRKELKKAEID